MDPVRALFLLVLAAAAPPQASRPATVSGRVVDAGSGRPIAGVVVTAAGSAVPITPASPLPPRALTNGQGEFVLRGLRQGTVFFTAAKNGYADATYKQRRPNGSGQGIPLARGQQAGDVEIRMWRHASITGTVVDEAGEPAVGVRVQEFRRGFVAGRRRFTPGTSAVTDDRGVYRIANLMPGDYAVGVPSTQRTVPTEVMNVFFASSDRTSEQRTQIARELGAVGAAVVPPGSEHALALGDQTLTLPPGTLMPQADARGGLSIYPTVFHSAATTLAQASVLTLRSGEERGSVDIQVQPARASRVSGLVIAPDGPAANVGVRLAPADADIVVDSVQTATTVTNFSGSFNFPAVPVGQYVLTVLRPPRDPIDGPDPARIRVTAAGDVTIGSAAPPAIAGPQPPPPVPLDATLYAQIPIAVGETAADGVIVALAVSPRVSGRVEFEGSADRPTGPILSDIRINLDPADGSRLPDPSLAFRAGHPEEDGSFRTVGVPPGKYVLRANPPSGWFLKGAFAGGIDLSDMPFDLTAKDLAGVVLTFTDRPSTLTGTVRTGTAADPDAVVVAFPTDSSAWGSRGAFPRRMRTARADKDGAYTINGLVPGEYHVVAVHEESFADWQDPALLDALSRVARQVRILEGERRTEDLSAATIK